MNHLFLVMLCWVWPFLSPPALQQEVNDPAPESLYDFWVGEWHLTWTNKDGEEYHGENIIRRIMDDHVIEENFRALDGNLAGFEGKSWTVYDQASSQWKQTWVDNQGSYLDFTGQTDGDKRIFIREGTGPDGKKVYSRMVFHHITADAFDWDWQRSRDGTGWETVWAIHYERKSR